MNQDQQLRTEIARLMPILERLEDSPLWAELSAGTGVATLNGLQAALTATQQAAPSQGAEPVIFSNLYAEIDSLKKSRDELLEFANMVKRHQKEEPDVWYWQNDGLDHLESMVSSLPVVIRADHLRALIKADDRADGEPDESPIDALRRQLREVAEASYKTPGIAVAVPELVSTEGRKLMRGEPSLFDQLPFKDMQDIGQQLSSPLLEASTQREQPAASKTCWCENCDVAANGGLRTRMSLCPECGNKRCPKATNHANACTGSNEVGQVGSSWEHVKPAASKPEPPLCKCGLNSTVPHICAAYPIGNPASKQEPQAQAGEPESLAARLRNTPNWMRESYGSWKDCTLVYDRAPFEAADALEDRERLHKEVLADLDIRINWLEQTIAKKDAALKACVEALEESKRWHNGDKWRTHGNEEQIAAWKAHRDAISAAITQGQEALK